jgi:hypothetical protein
MDTPSAPATNASDSAQSIGSAQPRVSTVRRFWELTRRFRKIHWILLGIVASLFVAALVGIGMWLVGDSGDSDNAGQTQATTAEFLQTAVAQVVQSGDDSLRVSDFSPTSEDLETLASIERLRIVRVDGGSLTPEAGRTLAAMPHLEQLHFRNVSIDDATLDAIAQSQTIWLLNITGAQLSSDSIGRLASMPKLQQLRLSLVESGSQYVEPIMGIKKLRALHLIGFPINNQSLKRIANMPNLESLYLDDSNVTDEGWNWLFENKPHLHVHIDQKHHDRDPQKH